MKDLSVFQLIVFGICGVLVLAGIIAFATYSKRAGGGVGDVTIWGTLPQESVDRTLLSRRSTNTSFLHVSYVEVPAADFDARLLNAIASGRSPDLVLLPQEDLYAFRDKLLLIPYGTVSKAEYQSAFVGESDLFLAPQGIMGMPFALDPLVMYWNTDLFAAAGIALPPAYWSELLSNTVKLTRRTEGSLDRSAIAMGTWSNIQNAKAILSALTMQAGDRIVSVDEAGKPVAQYGERPGQLIEPPAVSALRFYTDFADPAKTSYTWNRSLPAAEEAFAAGDVAVYLGFASEYKGIAARNPNLRFGIQPLPQAKGTPVPLTYGRMTALVIPRGTNNYNGAVAIARLLSDAVSTAEIADALGLPPVRRDLITPVPNDANKEAFMQSALLARGWLDPDPKKTDELFRSMVESVLSGQYGPSEAVANAAMALQRMLPI
jgi:ABC-type glycerol-3-phosphate transport system substrate-binding protein